MYKRVANLENKLGKMTMDIIYRCKKWKNFRIKTIKKNKNNCKNKK